MTTPIFPTVRTGTEHHDHPRDLVPDAADGIDQPVEIDGRRRPLARWSRSHDHRHGDHQQDGEDRDGGPPRLVRWAGPLVVTGLLAAAAVRFLDNPEPPSNVTTPRTPADVIAGLEGAVANRPDDLVAWQQLGGAYLSRAAQTGDPSYYDQAGAAFDQADRIYPDHPSSIVARASLALSQHQFERALALGEKTLAQRPGNPETLAVLVDANVELGRYEAAADYSQQLLDARPGVAALTRASYQRELRGDRAGALTAMVAAEAAAGGEAAAFRGGDARPLVALATVVALQGEILFNGGRAEDAATRYRRALELAPDLTLAEVGLARADAAVGRTAIAIERLERSVNRVPTLQGATLLADLQRLAGVASTGDDLVDIIVQLQRSNGATIDLELAVHLANRGRPDIALAETAFAAQPSIYGADALAWSLTRAGRAPEALPYVEQSLKLGGGDAALRAHAAMAFDAVGDAGRARDELSLAFSTNPFFRFDLRAEWSELASRLGVAVPPEWTP